MKVNVCSVRRKQYSIVVTMFYPPLHFLSYSVSPHLLFFSSFSSPSSFSLSVFHSFSANLIRTIDKNAVVFIKAAIESDTSMQLNLKGNPFHCDCYLKDFVKLLKANYPNVRNVTPSRAAVL